MNRFSLLLALLAIALVASVTFAGTLETGTSDCAYFSNGHIHTHSGVQYQIRTPGDYQLSNGLNIRQTQCPGAPEGVLCITALRKGTTEVHYNAEANLIRTSGFTLTEFIGHEEGYHVSDDDDNFSAYFFPNAQAVFFTSSHSNLERNGNNGLCGDALYVYRNYDLENPVYPVDFNEEKEDTFERRIIDISNSTQEEIEEFAQTWTAARLGETLISGHVADVRYGDFSTFEAPESPEISELNEFFIHHHLCSNANRFTLRGLYNDYTDYEHCAHHLSENTVMHIFKTDFINGEDTLLMQNGVRINFQNYWENNLESGSYLTDGTSKSAINLWAKVGGKYNFESRYDNLCGQEVLFNTNVDIQCNGAPGVDIADDLFVNAGENVVLRANMSDPEDDDLIVSWKIVQVPRFSVPSQHWGYDDSYFAFTPTDVGTYVVEVAVSDYCNVVYNTVNVEVRCEDCSDTRINLETTSAKLRLVQKDVDQYQQSNLDFFTSDRNPLEIEEVSITPQDNEKYYFLDDGENEIEIYSNEAVAETKDPETREEFLNECNFEEYTADPTKFNSLRSFKKSLLIPTLDQRGSVVNQSPDSFYNETNAFRRVQGSVLHHRIVCTGDKIENQITETTEVFETPAEYLCDLHYDVMSNDRLRLTLTKQNNVHDQCNMVFHVNTTTEIGDCNRPHVSTIFPITSDCLQPEANPRCPIDTYEFDYAQKQWTEAKLNGKDSHDGRNFVYNGNDEIDFTNTLNFEWTVLNQPDFAQVSISQDTQSETDLVFDEDNYDVEGEYHIRLEVSNGCLDNHRDIMIQAKCPIEGPSADISISNSNDAAVTFDVDNYEHEFHGSEVYPVEYLEFEVFVTNYDNDAVDNLYEKLSDFYTGLDVEGIKPRHVGRYAVEGRTPLNFPPNEDDDVVPLEESRTIGGIATQSNAFGFSYRPSGSYDVTGRVTDGCRHTTETRTVTIGCVEDSPTVEFTTDIDNVDNDFNYNAQVDTNAQNTRFCWIHESGYKECNNNGVFVLREGKNTIEVIAFNNFVCEIADDSQEIDLSCDSISFRTSSNNAELTSQHHSSHEIVVDQIQIDGEDSMTNSPHVCLLNEFDQCIDDQEVNEGQTRNYNDFGISVRVEHVPEDGDDDEHYEIEISGNYMTIGEHKFRIRVYQTNECYGDEIFTLTVVCIDDITASPIARESSITYDRNGFPSVSVGALLNNADDEDKVQPDEDIVYFWEFVSVPEDSAYFAFDIQEQVLQPPVEETTTSITYIPVDDDYDVPEGSPDLFKERLTTMTHSTKQQLRRILQRSVLNREEIASTDYVEYTYDDYYIDHKKYMPGCFTPDVQGTYELELKTALKNERVKEECPIENVRISVNAECNAAPSVNVVGANEDGLIEVDIERDSYDYSRVVLSLEAEDQDNDNLSIEWTYTGGIREGRPGSEREMRESDLNPNEYLIDNHRYVIVDAHTRDPSFLVGVAGDYHLTVSVDDGCTRITRDIIVRVNCGGSTFRASAEDVAHSFEYRSFIDIDQFSFSTVPSTSGDYFCQQPLFKSLKVSSWDVPDEYESPAARAIIQPIVAIVALMIALIAVFF